MGIDSDEKIQTVINIKGIAEDDGYLFFTTRQGTVKRTSISAFSNIRSNGIRAIVLRENDELMKVSVTDGKQNIIIGTHLGYAVSFEETAVRNMGRSASGVRGIRLREEDYVVGMDLLTPESEVLIITEKGYGKRTSASEYAIKGRGGKGVKTANITEKNGNLAGLTTVKGEEDIMLITNAGVIIRFSASSISQTGRVTLGVRLIRVGDNGAVSTMAKVDAEEVDVEEEITESGMTTTDSENLTITETTPIVEQPLLDEEDTSQE